MDYRIKLAVLSLAAAVVVSGCATTEMETARQLEGGELVASGSATMPGTMVVIPRFSGNVRYGYGIGDVGAHLGTSFYLVNIGAGARVYPSEFFTVGVQGDFLTPLFDFDGDGNAPIGQLTVTPRVLTTAQEGRPVYGGIEATVPIPLVGPEDTTPDFSDELPGDRFVTPVAGPVVGVDHLINPQRGMGFQAELSFKPIRLHPQWRRSVDPQEAAPIGQLSLGIYYRNPGSEPPEDLEPTPQDEPAEQPADPPPPQQPEQPETEPEPEPDFDDDGVPVY